MMKHPVINRLRNQLGSGKLFEDTMEFIDRLDMDLEVFRSLHLKPALDALADCVQSMKRLEDRQGAYRQSCIRQAEQILEYHRASPPAKFPLLAGNVMKDIESFLDEIADGAPDAGYPAKEAARLLAELRNTNDENQAL